MIPYIFHAHGRAQKTTFGTFNGADIIVWEQFFRNENLSGVLIIQYTSHNRYFARRKKTFCKNSAFTLIESVKALPRTRRNTSRNRLKWFWWIFIHPQKLLSRSGLLEQYFISKKLWNLLNTWINFFSGSKAEPSCSRWNFTTLFMYRRRFGYYGATRVRYAPFWIIAIKNR